MVSKDDAFQLDAVVQQDEHVVFDVLPDLADGRILKDRFELRQNKPDVQRVDQMIPAAVVCHRTFFEQSRFRVRSDRFRPDRNVISFPVAGAE